ncbi:hypothetical protein [Clavibacter michiganensis]|uniref:hypothetical protein n=1 Tax=Clavibacter michiganensis TaxID=28447 RepID=UPI001056A2B6|nr:hypothetical protein [Clavibacter michiganensis]
MDDEGLFHTVHVWKAMELLSDSLSAELASAPGKAFDVLRHDVQRVSGDVVDSLIEVDEWGDQSEYVERVLPDSYLEVIRMPSTMAELRKELVTLPWAVPLQWRMDASMLGVDIVALASARRATIKSRAMRRLGIRQTLRHRA